MEKGKSDQIATIVLDRSTLLKALEECLRIGMEGESPTVKILFCHERDIHFPADPVTGTGKRMCEYLRTLGGNPASLPST